MKMCQWWCRKILVGDYLHADDSECVSIKVDGVLQYQLLIFATSYVLLTTNISSHSGSVIHN